MTPTLTRRPRPAPARNIGGNLLVGTAVAAVALVALVMAPAMQIPRFVNRLTVTNPTVYALEIDVRGSDGPGWLDVGGVRRESARSSYDLIDQGREWTFRFTYAGDVVGEVSVLRTELSAGGWRLTVPADVGNRLAAAGVPPSAR